MSNSTEALDKQTRVVRNNISNKEEKIPAIDRLFMEERNFITYIPPPLSILTKNNVNYQGSLEEYEERLKLIEDDLKWILSLPYQKFWSQAIYDESFQKMIDSYLKLAPRPHDVLKLKNLPLHISELHNNIHRFVFLTYLRLSTYKESKDDYMNVEAYAKIIYNNYIFDIPKIFDLSVLYEKNQILPKMIENLFTSQSKYYDDFKLCVKDLLSAFEKSKQTIRKLFDLDAIYYSKGSVDERNRSNHKKISDNLQPIIELVYYLTDFSITLSKLTNIHSKLLKFLIDQKFEYHIKDMMENTIFYMEDILNKMIKSDDLSISETASLIKIKLKTLKYQLAKLFKIIFESGSTKPLISNLDNPIFSQDQIRIQEQECIDYFIQICCDIMEEKRFLCYYEEKFCLSDQIGLMVQLTDNRIDDSQYKFLMENLKSSVLAYSKKKLVKSRFIGGKSKEKNSELKMIAVSSNNPTCSGFASASTSIPGGKSSEEVDGMVQSVLDLLPGNEIDTIKKCLKYYDYNVEQVINAFLENNLPEFSTEQDEDSRNNDILIKIDDENECVTSKFSQDFFELTQRKNIYDGDKFDIFNKAEIDKTHIYVGKKKEIENFDLDDKKEVDREFYKNYDQMMYERVLKEQGIDPDNNLEYEDEYDDTYDSNTNAFEQVEPESFIKPLNQKLEVKKRDGYENYEEDEEESERNANQQKQSVQELSYNKNNPQFSQQGRHFQNNQNQDSYQKPSQNLNQRPTTSYNQKSGNYNQNQNNERDSRGVYKNNGQKGTQKSQINEANNQKDKIESQPQHQKPLPQRAPKNQRRFQQSNKNSELNNDVQASEKPFSQKFQDKYSRAKTSSDSIRLMDEAEKSEPQNSEPRPTKEEIKEQVKRERKWKNENKNKHRKDQAASKGNFF